MKGIVLAIVLLFSATCYGQDGYRRYDEPYRVYVSPHATNPPRIYSSGGKYLGELSTNRYAPDSVSNPYGRYGSRYSPDSINNPYGPYGRYNTRPIWVYPRR